MFQENEHIDLLFSEIEEQEKENYPTTNFDDLMLDIEEEKEDELTLVPPEKKSQTSILCLVTSGSCILCSFIILVIFSSLLYYQVFHRYVTKSFKRYEVVFDTLYSIPVSSTQKTWESNVPSRRTPWRDEKFSAITSKDYQAVQNEYQRGHLTPWNSIGRDSNTIINVVPQLKCHNQGVWNQFEMQVKKLYLGQKIVTYPSYGWFGKKIQLRAFDALYIPSWLCKTIDGVDYCMKHDESVCKKHYCKVVSPRFPGC
eukprot:gene7503-11826_t